AIAAMGVLRERGFDVPDDVAVVGYNDTPLAAELTMPLTTIRSPMHEMGIQGFELLWRRLEGQDPASVRLVPRLAARARSLGRGNLVQRPVSEIELLNGEIPAESTGAVVPLG